MNGTKRTTSDAMKDLLVAISAMPSSGDDWKRLSKKKNEAGQLVREFQNKATGEQFALTEVGGGEVTIQQTVRSRVVPAPFPVMEADKARNEAAARLLAEYDELDEDEVHRLQQKAGVALANRFCFAYCQTDDGPCWIIAPMDEAFGGDMEQTGIIGHLMPINAGEVTEATWVITPEYFSPLRRAADFMARGFIFDPEFQRNVDAKQEPLIQAILNARKGPDKGPQPAP